MTGTSSPRSPRAPGLFGLSAWCLASAWRWCAIRITGTRSVVAKSERLILLPIPEATTRASALLSGQVDFIEVPPPDFVPRLKAKGFVVTSNVYPHYWPYFMSFREGSPWRDVRVRKAVNLAIDRAGIVKLLGGLAEPAKASSTTRASGSASRSSRSSMILRRRKSFSRRPDTDLRKRSP